MKAPHRSFLIREADGVRAADTLVLGPGMLLGETAGGLPELLGAAWAEVVVQPSGGDDTQAIRNALATGRDVRLAPGTFSVKDPIPLGGQSVRGCGPYRTAVLCPFEHMAVFTVSGAGTAIENLALIGPGMIGIGTMGILATGATDLRFRDLRIERIDYGIVLNGTSRVEITSVVARLITNVGIQATGPGERMVVSGVSVSGGEGWGLQFTSMDGLSCQGISVRECAGGMFVNGGSSHALRDVRIVECGPGLGLSGVSASELAGVRVLNSTYGIAVGGCTGVTLGGCGLQAGTPLNIGGGQAVTASGIHTETTGSGAHVVVQGGATEVVITGIHRVNPATPPTYEVDVSGAGGRVLFAQHNFDPAHINSGGNFAAL